MKRIVILTAMTFFIHTSTHAYNTLGAMLYLCGTNPITIMTGLTTFGTDTAYSWYKRDQASNLTALRPARPHKTVFAFDLHHVLFKPDYPTMLANALLLFFTTPRLWNIILNPKVTFRIICALTSGKVGEKVLNDLGTIHPGLKEFQDKGNRIANCQIPIKRTFELIKELKKRGFEIYLLSNIGSTTFKEFQELYPDYFDDFDGFFMPMPEYTYLHKPDLRMYLLFLDTFDLKAEQTIFVDDKADNVLAARSVGMNSVLFSEPHHFECVLHAIRALPSLPGPVPASPQACNQDS
ncbi:HAD-IA family hydrolase [Candidatus Babeliales bacterium]|nr:HAD-IA family hydrolase [Candidatus Babeliales bacterium]